MKTHHTSCIIGYGTFKYMNAWVTVNHVNVLLFSFFLFFLVVRNFNSPFFSTDNVKVLCHRTTNLEFYTWQNM